MPNNNGQGNKGTEPVLVNASHPQRFGSMLAGPSNTNHGANSSSNPKHNADDFFNIQDMDCLIQNFSGSGMNTNSTPGAYHVNPFGPQQSSATPNMETRGQWSSETSNFGSDDSETKGHE
ncbi:hypothetical protein ACJIZ3_025373 [Penstemon smallii]|uniref:Uncharacterized protein n=1 Tax=Penstemon smallii TaxID=265156 RepID=A0ABD3TUL2_9LAMI